MFEKIQSDLKQRMAHYNDSRQPTGDEVTIAWLISEIERLREKINKRTGSINKLSPISANDMVKRRASKQTTLVIKTNVPKERILMALKGVKMEIEEGYMSSKNSTFRSFDGKYYNYKFYIK